MPTDGVRDLVVVAAAFLQAEKIIAAQGGQLAGFLIDGFGLITLRAVHLLAAENPMAVKGAQIGIQLPHSFVGVAGDQSLVHKGASLLIELDRTDQPSGILWEEFVKGIAVFGFYQGVDHFDHQMIIALAQQIGLSLIHI